MSAKSADVAEAGPSDPVKSKSVKSSKSKTKVSIVGDVVMPAVDTALSLASKMQAAEQLGKDEMKKGVDKAKDEVKSGLDEEIDEVKDGVDEIKDAAGGIKDAAGGIKDIVSGVLGEEAVDEQEGNEDSEVSEDIQWVDNDDRSWVEDLLPGDVLFFCSRGVSSIINYMQKLEILRKHHYSINLKAFFKDEKKSKYSHVALVVDASVFVGKPAISLEPGKKYTFEWTMSGWLNDGVNCYLGDSFFGCQIRSLDELLDTYTRHKHKAIIAYAKPVTRWNVPPVREDFKSVRAYRITRDAFVDRMRCFETMCRKFLWTSYDANLLTLASAVLPVLRPLRPFATRILHTKEWTFCSEGVYKIYRQVPGAIPEGGRRPNSNTVIPVDLLGLDADGLPRIFDDPVNVFDQQTKRPKQESEEDEEEDAEPDSEDVPDDAPEAPNDPDAPGWTIKASAKSAKAGKSSKEPAKASKGASRGVSKSGAVKSDISVRSNGAIEPAEVAPPVSLKQLPPVDKSEPSSESSSTPESSSSETAESPEE